jgi:hypothetical protein
MPSLTSIVSKSTDTSEGDVVGGKATGFATVAGFGAATTAIAGAVIAAVQQFADLKVDPALKVAALGLVGLGALSWAIASVGDVLGRAYASSHVVPSTGAGQKPTPLLQWALTGIDGDPAPLAVVLGASSASDAGEKSGASTAGTAQIVPLPASIKVSYQGVTATALAIRVGDADALSVLIAQPGESPEWVVASATALHP